jgi:hypothetical protein
MSNSFSKKSRGVRWGGGKFLPWSHFEIFPEGATPYLHSPLRNPERDYKFLLKKED